MKLTLPRSEEAVGRGEMVLFANGVKYILEKDEVDGLIDAIGKSPLERLHSGSLEEYIDLAEVLDDTP